MTDYQAPVPPDAFHDRAPRRPARKWWRCRTSRRWTPRPIEAVLEEAAKFAGGVLAPINWLGDQPGRQGRRRRRRGAPGVHRRLQAVLRRRLAGALPRTPSSVARGCRRRVALACDEMWAAANVAFALCPELSQGAILAMDRHAHRRTEADVPARSSSRAQWAGTMCLTEPQAGSRPRRGAHAAPSRRATAATGSPARKIFITYGDHDYGREHHPPGARAHCRTRRRASRASRCSSCPSSWLNADGTPGERNDVHCVSIEHKLGIHASPTCGAGLRRPWRRDRLPGRRGEPRPRSTCSSMMNHARFARRRAGRRRSPSAPTSRRWPTRASACRAARSARASGAGRRSSSHPDVRRMLLTDARR
ncbi:MAG: hypothetical protein MZV65_42225 [Chromatiales bacterium]|nr:hypothetical protein [Chromatiales bacterium]